MFQTQVVPLQITSDVVSSSPTEVIDPGQVKVGDVCCLVTPRVSAQCADNGKVKIGGACRLPNR